MLICINTTCYIHLFYPLLVVSIHYLCVASKVYLVMAAIAIYQLHIFNPTKPPPISTTKLDYFACIVCGNFTQLQLGYSRIDQYCINGHTSS